VGGGGTVRSDEDNHRELGIDSEQKRPIRTRESKVALVGWKDFVFGMLHMFEAFAAMADDPQEYQVFRDIAPAKAWLVSSRVGS
jgi:hypothetical protein